MSMKEIPDGYIIAESEDAFVAMTDGWRSPSTYDRWQAALYARLHSKGIWPIPPLPDGWGFMQHGQPNGIRIRLQKGWPGGEVSGLILEDGEIAIEASNYDYRIRNLEAVEYVCRIMRMLSGSKQALPITQQRVQALPEPSRKRLRARPRG